MIKACNRIIEYSFYGLFLLTPLAFTSKTSELFELNKMWLVWALTIIIVAFWLIKMVLRRRILFQRTPLDIPIALFLVSQIISTIFSLDSYVSLWGYYSRFNGGLLSTIAYILLYYSFLSNFQINAVAMAKRMLSISLISGLFVALWGLPSHFGYDPTCLLFRGNFDVSCWTADFMPRVRIFSTLGQPAWLAAYLAILIPIAIAFFIQKTQNAQNVRRSENLNIGRSETLIHQAFRMFRNKQIFYVLLAILFYLDLLYTRARSGFLGIWFALIFFAGLYAFSYGKRALFSNLKSLILIPIIITFFIGSPINQLDAFTLGGVKSYFTKPAIIQTQRKTQEKNDAPAQSINSGGTESANIRLNVWTGAINAWRANPIFGTGVETFAFAYYKYKPAGQNLTSEWNFLYNKAHNEYLNYLATTGLFGLGTYVIMITVFLWISLSKITNSFANFANKLENVREEEESRSPQNNLLTLALLSGYASILVTNFFGFSVVITNLYLFMIPAFVFILTNTLKDNSGDQYLKVKDHISYTSIWQWTPILFIVIISSFLLVSLFRFWRADISYALGYNLDRAKEYQQAYPNLRKAVQLRGDEPVFKDELSFNNAVVAIGLVAQKPQNSSEQEQITAVASSLAQEAINMSNEVISQYPNNAVFWKTRTRLFYTLSQVDSRYLPRALDAIVNASLLAPNDASILYNLGVLYGQNDSLEKGIEALEKTIRLKPDYRDAHYGLGLFYHQAGQKEKAIAQIQYILDEISPTDPGAQESLKNWGK